MSSKRCLDFYQGHFFLGYKQEERETTIAIYLLCVQYIYLYAWSV